MTVTFLQRSRSGISVEIAYIAANLLIEAAVSNG